MKSIESISVSSGERCRWLPCADGNRPDGYRYLGQAPVRILPLVTPAGIEKWFEEVGALEKQAIPEVIDLGKKYGLEFLPPPAA